MDGLWSPQDPVELYYAQLGEDVPLTRPIFQGDVFAAVHLPGHQDDAENLVMLVTHPCSMMVGNWYIDRMEAVRVRRANAIPFERWNREAFETLPMPNFSPATETSLGGDFAAFFHERATVATPLQLEKRVGALSLDGVVALQQRLANETCRVAVGLHLLHGATDPLWAELELLEEWNERLIEPSLLEEPDSVELLRGLELESKAFYEVLCQPEPARSETTSYSRKFTLQEELRVRDRRAAVRNALQGAAKKRHLDRTKSNPKVQDK